MNKRKLSKNNITTLLKFSHEQDRQTIAIKYQEKVLSYEELECQVNKRVNFLHDQVLISLNDVVAIFSESKLSTIVWVLAILKAGGAFVVLDLKWPEQRLRSAVSQSQAKVIIAENLHHNIFNQCSAKIKFISIDQSVSTYSDEASVCEVYIDSLAYIVFTSGSTGKPKGVKMSHGALLTYLNWELSSNYFKHRVLQFFSLSFDISFQEFFTPLTMGGSVVILEEDKKTNISQFVSYITSEKVTKLYLSYSYLLELSAYCYQNNIYPAAVLSITCSGEKLMITDQVKAFFYNIPQCRLTNLYGASEIQVISAHTLAVDPASWPSQPLIGHAITPVTIYILDEEHRLVEDGVAGAIYIKSDCLTSGYITDDMQQHKKFMKISINGEICHLYHTGDVGLRLQNGDIQHLGRTDSQLKIRGYRVELAEIDQVVMQVNGIKQAVTTPLDMPSKHISLITYVVADIAESHNESQQDIIENLYERADYKYKHIYRLDAESGSYTNVTDNATIAKYFHRKSYRVFHGGAMHDAHVDQLLTVFKYMDRKQSLNSNQPTIKEFLSLFAPIYVESHVLPKYRYPSAGALYPVYIYIEVGNAVSELSSGCYCYNHHQNKLEKLHDSSDVDGVLFSFVADIALIKPLYGSLSESLCWLELGYMLALAKQQLPELISVDLHKISGLSEQQYLLGTYRYGNHIDLNHDSVHVYLYFKDDIGAYNGGWYIYNFSSQQLERACLTLTLCLTSQSKDNYAIYHQSAIAIFFMSEDRDKHAYLDTGIISQTIMQQVNLHNIGLCPIGSFEKPVMAELEKATSCYFIQALFGGPISQEQMQSQELLKPLSLKTIITNDVKSYLLACLPSYMQPNKIVILDHIPVTPNGKIDKQALPKLDCDQSNIIDPSTQTEQQLRYIWALLLSMNEAHISIEHELISLGGDSIIAMRMIQKIYDIFNIQLSVVDIFDSKTIKSIAYKIDTAKNHDLKYETNDNNAEKIYLANSLQQGFIYHALNQGNIDDAYIVQSIWSYHSVLDIDKLKHAWRIAQYKYPSLRLRFSWDDQIQQIIDPVSDFDWHYDDVSKAKYTDSQKNAYLKHIQDKIRLEKFDLAKSGLFKIYLICFDKADYVSIFTHHHIIIDGWSHALLFKNVHRFYVALINNKPIDMRVDDCYLAVQKQRQEHADNNMPYWQQYLAQLSDRINLIGLLKNKSSNLSQAKYIAHKGELTFELDNQTVLQLNNFSADIGVTVSSIVQYLWHKVCHVFGNSDQTTLGTVFSGRDLPINGIEASVGLYINTLPVIVDHQCNQCYKIIDLLKSFDADLNQYRAHSDVALSKLQQGGERLFDILSIFDNYAGIDFNYKVDNILYVTFKENIEKLDYPLVFISKYYKRNLYFNIQYDAGLFERDAISTMLAVANHLLKQIILNPYEDTRNLTYLNSDLYHRIADQWNATSTENNWDSQYIIDLFIQQVHYIPDRIALVCNHVEITYTELDRMSSKLAGLLLEQGVKRNDFIGFYLESSHFVIIAILAILKTGAAYVPIDAANPENRLRYILNDSGIKQVLTSGSLARKLPEHVGHIIIDAINYEHITPIKNIVRSHNQEPFYLLYTSGSTGQPKSSMINHASIKNLIQWYLQYYKDADINKVLVVSSVAFDLTQKNLIATILGGGELHFVNSMHFDAQRIIEHIATYQILMLNCAPSAFYTLIDDKDNFHKLHSLRQVFLGGEAINLNYIKPIALYNSKLKIYNTYGPTECTDITTLYAIQQSDIASDKVIPIGIPIDNVKVFIIDKSLQLLPPGAVGELCVAGKCVSHGYLNKPGMTADKFIANPFQTSYEKFLQICPRLYRTGDLAYWQLDGNIAFLGRQDHQVKIRGVRIELGEIEHKIKALNIIHHAIALIKTDACSRQLLIVYVVLQNKDDDQDRALSVCKQHCRAELPDYMQPNHIIILKYLPLTQNGKINRQALLDIEIMPENAAGELPVGSIEQTLAIIWKSLLSIPHVNRYDNFFALGGDSIVCIQLVSRAKKQGIHLDVQQVFKTPILADLAQATSDTQIHRKFYSKKATSIVPLLPVQQWFFANAHNPNYFNQASWLLSTSKANICLDQLSQYLLKIYHHHDAFKLKFRKTCVGWEQYYDTTEMVKLDIISKQQWCDQSLEKICTDIQSSLNIETGPLTRLVWFEGKGLLWVIHHLLIDGVSWRILLEDLNDLYSGNELTEASDNYQLWSQYLLSYTDLDATENYYKNFLQSTMSFEVGNQRISYEISFSQQETWNFLHKCQQPFNTQANDLLLTALILAIGIHTNYMLSIDLEGHGREVLNSQLDLHRTIGWFTSIFPVYLTLSSPTDVELCIKEIKEQLRCVPEKGVVYGIASYIKNTLPKYKPQISFNYLGQWGNLENNNERFQFGDHRVGKCVGDNKDLFHHLDILGQVRDGRLLFIWDSYYPESILRSLADRFQDKLKQLIDYTARDDVFGYSPSDFMLDDISQDELDEILNS